MNIIVGAKAPDFTLASAHGTEMRLSDFAGQSVVLFFYSRDGNPLCVKEASAFRDTYDAFRDAGAAVVGISADPPESHRIFTEEHRLPYTLLSDEGNIVRRLYGITATFGFLPGRVTVIVDGKGIVRHIVAAQFNTRRHVEEAFAAVERIEKG